MIVKHLTLRSNKLEEQKIFYTETLGFSLTEESQNAFSIQIGHSELRFLRSEDYVPYHFAINIPSNQEVDALYYLKERVEIIKDVDDEIVFFENWNAHAIYFYDEDGNIVEYIARKGLDKNSIEDFGSQSCMGISEIALVLDQIGFVYDYLNSNCGIHTYSGSEDRFMAAGDEYGLFILLDKIKKPYWFPTNDKTQASDLIVEFLSDGVLHLLEFKAGRLSPIL